MPSALLPLFHNLQDRRALIVGGGRVAHRRCQTLRQHGLTVEIVAPMILPELTRLDPAGGVRCEPRAFRPEDVQVQALIVAATDDPAVNRQVADCARRAGIPVNIVDDPAHSDFVFPAVVDRAPLAIAIASGASSPLLTRLLRNQIDALIPAAYGALAELVGRSRAEVQRRVPDRTRRTTFWQAVLHGPIAEAVFSGNRKAAEGLLQRAIEDPARFTAGGEVYLIGAGPGDPGLLTLRAFRLLQQAEVVLYDRLVSQAVLDLVNPDAELIYVGKRRAAHTLPQQDINQLLVRHARAGKRVARLKGGDPFVFGRGGEEIEDLSVERIPFQVIPGITAAAGCASYAGIPLTHRDYAQSVRFLAGQLKDGTVDLPWNELVAPRQTLVFYMALTGLPVICRNLIAHGMDAEVPAAFIEKGTLPEQRVTTGTVGDIVAKVSQHAAVAPSLLIIGSVVALREKLAWYDRA